MRNLQENTPDLLETIADEWGIPDEGLIISFAGFLNEGNCLNSGIAESQFTLGITFFINQMWRRV
jgi:hypothetical protein